jgi:hypothetical protein
VSVSGILRSGVISGAKLKADIKMEAVYADDEEDDEELNPEFEPLDEEEFNSMMEDTNS